jgi:fructose-bisphosphate aldolase class 1
MSDRKWPRVHLDSKSREGDTCKLLLSTDKIDVDVKTLNKVKGDEVIKKLDSLLTRCKEKTC